MIDIVGIEKKYQKKEVLTNISLQVNAGTCVGILGENGCGKSTLLGILGGVIRPDQGTFLFDGIDLLKNKKRMNDLIGFVPQETPFLEELTAKDNLRLWFEKEHMLQELQSGVLYQLGITEFLDRPVRKLSGGMKKRLAIGSAMANQPKVLLLDEPTAALDIQCKQIIYQYLKQFVTQGGYVLITTHDQQDLQLCDFCYQMEHGILHMK